MRPFFVGDDGAIIKGGNIEGWRIHHQGRMAIRPYISVCLKFSLSLQTLC